MDKQLKKFMQSIKELEKDYTEEISFKGKYGEAISYFYKNINKGKQGIKLRRCEEKCEDQYELTLWRHNSSEVYEELIENFDFLNKHNQGLLACVYSHLDEKKQKEREKLREIENEFYAFPIGFTKPSLFSSLLVKKKKTPLNFNSRKCSVEDRL